MLPCDNKKNILYYIMSIIYHTGIFSLFIQIITAILNFYVLSLELSPSVSLVKNLLFIELIVQVIEGIFYIWLVMNFSRIQNVTKYRYYDWILTTPSMLFTYCIFLYYINTRDKSNTQTFYEAIDVNLIYLIPIFILNTMMLFFGYLAEIGKMDTILSAVLGFIPFTIFFYLIYDIYAKYTFIGRISFIYFSGIWALYGFASVLNYKYKNASYNILDLLSKNIFGIFLGLFLIYNK
jgi:hypothetical protein